MLPRPVLAANWKMNHGPSDARAMIDTYTSQWGPRTDRSVIVFPPIISVTAVVEALGDRTDISVGVQNIWTEDKGAFTGETSAPMARDAGAAYVLVGHSERRHVFGETDAQTARKCATAMRHGLVPMLCVGELLNERESGATHAVVLRQLHAGLSELTEPQIAAMLIAYEPVWAIGTGKTATPDDASDVHRVIRRALVDRLGASGHDVRILYGGSVNMGNAAALLAAENVDGLLVGGASLDPHGWARICEA
jgi:triosephosphate isomerase